MVLCLILIGILGFTVKGDLEKCKSDLQTLTQDNNQEIAKMLYYSGRDINDLGKYEECNDLENARYILLIAKVGPIVITFGICGPKSCEAEDYKYSLVEVIKAHPKVEEFMKSEDLDVQDVKAFNNRSYSWSAIISIIVIILLLIILSLGSYVDKKFQEDPNNSLTYLSSILICFSMPRNFSKLFTFPESSSNFQAFNGIRVLSMALISLGHCYVFTLSSPIANPATALDFPKGLKRRYIYYALYSVDVFFLLTGFFLSFFAMNEMHKRNGKMSWGLFIVHRLIRICPVYYFVYMLFLNVFPYIGSSSMWPAKEYMCRDICTNYWWTVPLFISNLYPFGSQACMGWGWYISNDMQFYILSPLILILHYKNKFYGYIALLVMIIANIITIIIISSENDFSPSAIYGLLNNFQFTHSYIKPYFRIGAFLLGIFLGFVYRGYCDATAKTQNTDIELQGKGTSLISPVRRIDRISKFEIILISWVKIKYLRYFAYILGMFLMIWVTIAPYKIEEDGPEIWSKAERSMFLGFEHFLFCIGFMLCIVPMIEGFGGFVKNFLSNKYFAIAAKISFSYYLVHPLLIYFWIYNKNQAPYMQDLIIWYPFFTMAFWSIMTATFLTLSLESPFIALEKVLFSRKH
ncbi:hypothetical protein SteCoe_32871 [Stentor coeruleus]|uniref:Acyltransferase 3 domain-containing protein n=1 Tax=Stentor coeruleus TaxID=5963 RepID=A0A1R2AY18_9CILI|nr:hypothetical protein SteCoe_32871 [Stentor coeruleus]